MSVQRNGALQMSSQGTEECCNKNPVGVLEGSHKMRGQGENTQESLSFAGCHRPHSHREYQGSRILF